VTAPPTRALLPYPGLRPFERHEADVFFGRETQVDAMVDRLGRHHLLAVTGSSGSGKSSLVRAGLLEALEAGLLATAGPVWRFGILRPGSHPMTELAAAVVEALGGPRGPDDVAMRRAKLERGPLSLIEELRERPLPDGGNLLILVDQFEEVFRYPSLTGREEAEAFVALLLATVARSEVPIYVVMTMRSDFLGRCADFDGLAEAVTDAQYLCPRLSRDQIRSAIEGPAQVFGGKVEPRLVSRVVNDMGTDPDQLPLMQHALMRLWELAGKRASNARQLRLDDYDEEGGIRGSLSRHADEILAEITHDSPERAETARRLFCLLVEGEGESALRRLSSVTDIIAVTHKPLDEVAATADPFRAPGRSLLMPISEQPLTPNTVLDISHESLIRQWRALGDWVRAEAASAEQYREIERRARRWTTRSATFLDDTDLDLALAWREREKPTASWAARYGGDFSLTMDFLDKSRDAESKRRRAALEAAEERAVAAKRLAERATGKARKALCEGELETATLIALAALPADSSVSDRFVWIPAVSVLAEARSRDGQRAVLQDHTAGVLGAAFSPDGERVVTASDDKTALLWDAKTGAKLALLQGHGGSVYAAGFSPDGARIVTASADNTARLWDAKSGASLAVLRGHTSFVFSAAFSPRGEWLVTASYDNTARLWSMATHESLAVLKGHTNLVNSAAFSPDKDRIVTASYDKTARLWDGTGAALNLLQAHSGPVNVAAFSPDGARIVTASADTTARLWDVTTGTPLTVLQGHTGAVERAEFNPDGTRIVTASADNTARLWDATSGAALAVLQGHTGSVSGAVFSPDGARIVTASADGTARLWDAETGALLDVLQGHTGPVHNARVSPDRVHIVTASADKTARLWDVWPLLTMDTVAYAKITALRALSHEEEGSLCLTEADPATGEKYGTDDDPAAVCDQLAANPFDPRKRAPGILFDAIDAEGAVLACRVAVETAPDEARLCYQLGRALDRADKREEAVLFIRTAAEKGYPAAHNDLGFRYENGSGVAKDNAEALRRYRQAAEGGYAPAFFHEGRLYWEGAGTEADRAEAVRWFKRGANQGDPFSHRRLAELYETGDNLPQNLEEAVLHYALATRLFELAGAAPDAVVSRARRGSLARLLPPETAVRIAREAAAWRPKGP
jgi:WD40 repeat protein